MRALQSTPLPTPSTRQPSQGTVSVSGIELDPTQRSIRLSDVARLKIIPRRADGKRISIKSVYRWALRGVRGVRLECFRTPSGLTTTIELVVRFLQDLNEAGPSRPSLTTAQRSRQIQSAHEHLTDLLDTKLVDHGGTKGGDR